MRPYFLTLKAEVLTGIGRLAEAGQALAAAEGDISAHGMAFCHGEVLRLQAGLAARAGDRAGPERMFAEAAAVAEAQGRSEEQTSEIQSLMRISYAVICL